MQFKAARSEAPHALKISGVLQPKPVKAGGCANGAHDRLAATTSWLDEPAHTQQRPTFRKCRALLAVVGADGYFGMPSPAVDGPVGGSSEDGAGSAAVSVVSVVSVCPDEWASVMSSSRR